MNAKILEIFRSVQGEGKYIGAMQVFVRFFECNMHCTWCDTPASIGDTSRNYKEYDLATLMATIRTLWQQSHSVSLTGGEPLMQMGFIKTLLPELKKEKKPVYLETNGIYYKELGEIIGDIDIIAMDFKPPSSTKERAFWTEHEEFLKISVRKDVFVKVVITPDTAFEDIERCVSIIDRVAPETLFILQPNYFEMKEGAVVKCLEYQDYCGKHLPNVRIIPQLHKFMKLR